MLSATAPKSQASASAEGGEEDRAARSVDREAGAPAYEPAVQARASPSMPTAAIPPSRRPPSSVTSGA